MKQIKILHLLNSGNYSGAENLVCQIIENSNREKYEMIYCGLDGVIEKVLKDKGIKYIKVQKLSFKEIKKVINDEKIEVVHAHDIRASCIAACFFKKCKVISHLHGNHSDMKKINLKTISYFLNYRFFSKVIIVSETIKNDFAIKGLLRESKLLTNVISYDSLQMKIELDKCNYDFDVVFLGRLNDIKDPLRVLEIFYETYKRNENIKMAFIGDGPLKSILQEKVKELKLEKNISLLGYLENPMKILSQSKMLILASKYEGTPMCILEAMGAGVPVISTGVDGVLTLIEDGKEGYISNDDLVLSKKIDYLYKNEDIRKMMSKNTLKKFKKISNIKKYINEVEKIYEEI